MPASDAARGFTLIEVMVALVVLAVGMLGTAMLMVVSVRSTHTAAMHTQTVLLARSMMDRMSANLVGVWQSAYDGSYSGVSAATTGCGVTSSCASSRGAQRDRAQWQVELLQSLPGGATAQIRCTPASPAPSGSALAQVAVYDGYCDLNLAWSEARSDGEVEAQNLAWRFVP